VYSGKPLKPESNSCRSHSIPTETRVMSPVSNNPHPPSISQASSARNCVHLQLQFHRRELIHDHALGSVPRDHNYLNPISYISYDQAMRRLAQRPRRSYLNHSTPFFLLSYPLPPTYNQAHLGCTAGIGGGESSKEQK